MPTVHWPPQTRPSEGLDSRPKLKVHALFQLLGPNFSKPEMKPPSRVSLAARPAHHAPGAQGAGLPLPLGRLRWSLYRGLVWGCRGCEVTSISPSPAPEGVGMRPRPALTPNSLGLAAGRQAVNRSPPLERVELQETHRLLRGELGWRGSRGRQEHGFLSGFQMF